MLRVWGFRFGTWELGVCGTGLKRYWPMSVTTCTRRRCQSKVDPSISSSSDVPGQDE